MKTRHSAQAVLHCLLLQLPSAPEKILFSLLLFRCVNLTHEPLWKKDISSHFLEMSYASRSPVICPPPDECASLNKRHFLTLSDNFLCLSLSSHTCSFWYTCSFEGDRNASISGPSPCITTMCWCVLLSMSVPICTNCDTQHSRSAVLNHYVLIFRQVIRIFPQNIIVPHFRILIRLPGGHTSCRRKTYHVLMGLSVMMWSAALGQIQYIRKFPRRVTLNELSLDRHLKGHFVCLVYRLLKSQICSKWC